MNVVLARLRRVPAAVPTAAPPLRSRLAPRRLAAAVPARSLSATATAGMAALSAQELGHFLADAPPTVVRLEIAKHFDALSDRQKRYAHYISRAAFAGHRIVLRQVSPEAEAIYDLILALHTAAAGDWPRLAADAGVEPAHLTAFLEYAAQFLGNAGNYKSFGDSKFLPRCPEPALAALAAASPAAAAHYRAAAPALFAADPPGLLHLGYPDDGHLTAYYPDSPGITKADIAAVAQWMEAHGLLPENTRLRKIQPPAAAAAVFELLIASAAPPPGGGDLGSPQTTFVLDGGATLRLVYGDHAREMAAVAHHLRQAAAHADNDTERQMHAAYARSFADGSLLAFKDSQRLWIRDKGPTVETNIGFVETYRDPAGTRGEWQGFVAMVNRERTRAFGALVDAAPQLIPLLPWSADFEKDTFLAPDFTSLEVLTFCGSGIPAGINIPNYDDIRQTEGFKNVSLGNVLGAKAPHERIPFVRPADLALYQRYRDAAFEVQVGLHELTGHGCGKLLQETSPGVYNFDPARPPVSPLTGQPVASWYRPGQTWGSVFGGLAGAYEECRAELVAMYLSCEFAVLRIFGFGDGTPDLDGEAGDLLYAAYLSMARAGLAALEFWDPKSQKWGQPHCQARFSILQCFLQAGDGFCRLVAAEDDLSDLTIHLDRSKILTVGRKAVGDYLQKLHIYKATADVANGTAFFADTMSKVGLEYWGTKVRDVVLKNKQPRKVFVQANTYLDEATGQVSLKEYDPTPEGLIQSWADREL